eukprot:4754741-Alexandrium_andersonii.AAC.1
MSCGIVRVLSRRGATSEGSSRPRNRPTCRGNLRRMRSVHPPCCGTGPIVGPSWSTVACA